MKKFWNGFLATVAMSFFVFPVGFTFLPESVNSKMLMAGLGLVVFLFQCVRRHSLEIPRYILVSGLLAACFSLWCLYAITAAGTHDTVYVLYIVSFFTINYINSVTGIQPIIACAAANFIISAITV